MAINLSRINKNVQSFLSFFQLSEFFHRINDFWSLFTGIRKWINSLKEGCFPLFHVISFLDASATSVGTKVVFVLDKMLQRRRPANEVWSEEAYERYRMTRLEQ